MIFIVSGSREFPDLGFVKDYIQDHVELGDTLIHGGARGVDKMAATIAANKGAHVVTVPAQWDKYGKAAGPIRNQEMIECGLEHKKRGCKVRALIFWDGKSKGTKHFLDTAVKLRLSHYLMTLDVGWKT
jgi:hypothetical protein